MNNVVCTLSLRTCRLKKGMTVIEIVVYVAILSLLLATVISSGTKLASVYRTLEGVRNINLSAITALERMIREVRSSTDINQSSSVFNTSPGTLELVTTDEAGAPATVKFSVLGGVLRVYENGSDAGALTFGSSTVANLVFRLIQTPQSKAVKIELSIDGGVSGSVRTKSFSDTAVMRPTYRN